MTAPHVPDPDQLVEVAVAVSEFEGAVIANVLQAEGIEARVFTSTETILGASLLTAGSAGVRVMTRAADADRARAALDQNHRDSVDLDWDTVDVGESTSRSPEDADPARLRRSLGILAFALLALVVLGVAAAAWLGRTVPGLPPSNP